MVIGLPRWEMDRILKCIQKMPTDVGIFYARLWLSKICSHIETISQQKGLVFIHGVL